MNALTVYKSKFPKIRIGSEFDGGYVIADINGYDALFSCGICDDVNFENAFLKRFDIPCFSYDGTIESLPKDAHKSIVFNKLNIGPENTEFTTNLDAETSGFNDIFLKMDIESHEFRWLNSLSDEFFLRFKQIVIEFHLPFTSQDYTSRGYDIDIPVQMKIAAIKKLESTHTLIHLHANNCCGTTVANGVFYPNVFECTFVRKDIQNKGELNKTKIPSSLDAPNRTGKPDIVLNWSPFVHK